MSLSGGLRWTSLGGLPREQNMLQGHLPRVIHHQVCLYTKIGPKAVPPAEESRRDTFLFSPNPDTLRVTCT